MASQHILHVIQIHRSETSNL